MIGPAPIRAQEALTNDLRDENSPVVACAEAVHRISSTVTQSGKGNFRAHERWSH
jgi:hypothetical protein